ncbi:MarR family winged helix-turn-helix transcriptional regulator [Gordonia sp. ABSL1-1]|uniref:MarR family winged helix-turn-helix transcriptional regulator n=1 Tax=Gordonia sp. ABSL1-1 TaxID=3053923 RepID=UPI002572ED17|nr:MarR family winged helix-turn-helix transcriptional regulator [Gordonia sp. ABSL1-1]MDL9935255.1 MarR family winged helix-turn-helix transcriptional regulator [Gordonia sp. ABSL1-1]
MSGDPIADLEAELADFWRRGRVRIRARTHAIDPALDPSCYPLIALLARRGHLRMSELAAELGLEKSTVTRQIDAVVRLGLVDRHPDPDDARARIVSLSEAGRQRFGDVVTSAVADWRTRLSRWNPDDIRTLTALLHRLGDASDETPPTA